MLSLRARRSLRELFSHAKARRAQRKITSYIKFPCLKATR